MDTLLEHPRSEVPPNDVSKYYEYYVGCGEIVRLPKNDGIFMPSPAGLFFLETLYQRHLLTASRETRILDMGCGSGIVAIALGLRGFKKIVGTDINSKHVEYAREQFSRHLKAPSSSVFRQSNLFENITDERFDIVAFNCPGWATPTGAFAHALRSVSGTQYTAMFEGDRIAAQCIVDAMPRIKAGGSLVLGLNSIGDVKSVLAAARRACGESIAILHLAQAEFPLLLYNDVWRAHADLLLSQLHEWRERGISYFRTQGEQIYWVYEVVEIRKRADG